MTISKRLICLANSRKLSGRCIAGRMLLNGKRGAWIRPVSNREHEEVSEHERQYEDGSDPKVLDIIDIPLIKAKPKGYQQENWLLDPDKYWALRGRATLTQVRVLVDPVSALWDNDSSTVSGLHDRISLTAIRSVRNSLRLIQVPRVKLKVFRQNYGDQKLRVQGCFDYGGVEYQLRVTDPNYEREYFRRGVGSYNLGECFLTISLGEPFKGFCYKLIAAVIERKDVGS